MSFISVPKERHVIAQGYSTPKRVIALCDIMYNEIRAEGPKCQILLVLIHYISHFQCSNHTYTFYTGLRFTSPCAVTCRGFAPLKHIISLNKWIIINQNLYSQKIKMLETQEITINTEP
jgi:hypothetical protein